MNGPQFLFFPFNKNFLWPSFVMVENNAENDLTCWCIVVVSLVMGPKEGLVTTEWHFKWARSRHPIPISIIMISLCHYHHYHRNRLLTLFSDFSNWNFHFPYLKIAWKWHSQVTEAGIISWYPPLFNQWCLFSILLQKTREWVLKFWYQPDCCLWYHYILSYNLELTEMK